MKPARRLISGALSMVMAFSLGAAALPAAYAAPASPAGQTQALTGSIGLTLRFDLPQTAANAAGRGIRLRVDGPGGAAVAALPGGTLDSNTLGAAASVLVKNVDGAELTSETRVGYYEVELSGLPAGGAQYELTLTGTGYKTFTQTVVLDGYSRHIIVGTGDGTFSLGDLNGDGAVDDRDLVAMDSRLGQAADRPELAVFDLNGDGKLDVTDLAYVNHSRGITGEALLLDAAAIVAPVVDTAGLAAAGQVEDLFRDGGVVTLSPAAGAGGLSIPIELPRPVEMSEIQITCPEGGGAIRAGAAVAELEDGSTLRVPFDVSLPEGVHAIGRTAGQRLISIDLGRKAAVKKVTIQVTATDGPEGFATVTKIEFLKDIVPDNPKNDADQAKGLGAAPGDGQVTLAWNAVRNVTGYTVAYGESAAALTKTVSVNTNRAVISGLENMKTYYFQVAAVNGGWRGTPSEIVSGTPEPGRVPGAPSNIRVTPSDQSLRVSWGSTKDAVYYQVFYRTAGQSAFQQSGGNLSGTSAVITGLTNGTAYEVAVKAGNGKGVGPYSATASGTPRREELAMPSLPEDDRIDNSHVVDVAMSDPGNVDRNLCPNFTPMQVVDGDAATYWIARAFWEGMAFTYTFDEPQDMNYVVWVPYLQGNYKYMMARYSITAMDEAGNVLASGTYPAPAMTDKNYLVLPFPMVKGVKKLTVSLAQVEGRSAVNIAEMAFYKGDPLAEDIAALFTDGSFTALKPGVSAETVAALSRRLDAKPGFYMDPERLRDELALAQGLAEGRRDVLGVVQNGVQSRSGGQDRPYGQSASDLQPLGVSAKAGAVVAVYANIPGGEQVTVVPTQFFGESGVWRGSPVQLVNGRNYITVPKIGSLTDERGGPLYLTYAGDHPEKITLQVRGDRNVFPVPVLELSGWYDMGEAARREAIRDYVTRLQSHVSALGGGNLAVNVRNATEISTPSVLLSIPADRALAGLQGVGGSVEQMVETMYQNVLAWEEELFVANKVQGIIDSGTQLSGYRYPMTTRQNIRYMRMFAGAFMYAAGNHVGVGYGSTSGLMSGKPSSAVGGDRANGLFGWGIAHEIGHNMDKLGKAEITNNIYSLAIQAWDGGSMAWPTRLTLSNIWPAVFEKTAAGRPGSAGNVFVQLAMYWQLHLAYDQADRPLDFFNRFFRAWKAGEAGGRTYDERVALIAAKTAGRNLTGFFIRWGLTLSQDVKDQLAQYAPEPRAIWYLNDGAYAYRLDGGGAFDGTVEISASVSEKDGKVTLTISGGNEAVLGYEVLRDGKPVGFAAENAGGETAFTDDLGAANNLTYSYSVIPVDKLGNVGEETGPVEVLVAYDKAIDAGLYTVTREGGAVIITMRQGAVPVTGVKITGTALSGSYTVELKEDAAAPAWRAVKEGTLSGESAVGYFAKPGAEPGDTRIWTYDAAALRITGAPEGASVVPLDYPGDRVDFYEDACVGVLKEDYRYAEGEDGVIPAGTVVILGSYRGDPVYNTVEIQARYSTTPEAGEAAEAGATYQERPMNGEVLLFAEIPADGAVSDTSDGFWIFIPDWEAEDALLRELLKEEEIPGQEEEILHSPAEIRAVFYRNDDPNSSGSRRETSRTVWISFPERATLPQVELTGAQ